MSWRLAIWFVKGKYDFQVCFSFLLLLGSFNADEEIILTLNSSAPLIYFDYNIVGRGNILVSERVFVPNKANSYDLTLTPSFMWMPYARFYAYFIDELGDFHYAETSLQIMTEMQNEV